MLMDGPSSPVQARRENMVSCSGERKKCILTKGESRNIIFKRTLAWNMLVTRIIRLIGSKCVVFGNNWNIFFLSNEQHLKSPVRFEREIYATLQETYPAQIKMLCQEESNFVTINIV